ncbi:DUF4031 domain-containing protein [Nesterenkonia xinjiangensis]|uniref:Putative metal-dependent HD superfamily phosphohydrolase n=1 Tax=Nesterenkonia xinjiangensis TaxID=225327 RepID=A0A7Z0K8E7_9MICC|nr:DUF4031 domain-containing protein [Nesterenkonia xinjiangensis]NYJ77539.1 putative metal-dependent HD superfamily phosphohydrolase [Nesterenkonia xinjiangensis]
MTIYIDPPVWPAHGTLFSHLISDVSLDELHDFADRSGISPRAFDEDHYDVPQHRHRDLIARGAILVSGLELARILAECGLRIRSVERPAKVRARLSRAWARLLPADATTLGEELLERWSEPHRHYHSPAHLAAVLNAVGVLQRAGELPEHLRRSVLLAAWFHDAVYAGTAGQDEEDSARLAEDRLPGLLPDGEVTEVARLVRLTATHDPHPADVAGAVLVDADLEVLGRAPTAYRRYADTVRRDYDHVPDHLFRQGRAQVLASLLERPLLYRTAAGRRLWEHAARENLSAELARLRLE